MKALFKNRFPFVELPNDQLDDEQLAIKKIYNEMDSDVPCVPCEAEKTNRLRKIRVDEPKIGNGTK